MDSTELTGAMTKYLATIVEIEEEGEKIRAIDIANRNGVKKPSVCNAVAMLKDLGFITADGGRNIRLTERGRQIGQRARQKEQFFCELLSDAGLDEDSAKLEASRFAYSVSEKAYLALRNYADKERDS